MDHSLPGSSVHGILQVRIVEWVTISFCRASSQPRDQTQVSCIAGWLFTVWATRKAWHSTEIYLNIFPYISTFECAVCLVALSCLTLCDPMDCSPPGSSVQWDTPGKNTGAGCHAILQGILPTQGSNQGLLHCRWILYHLSHQGSPRILEQVAYPFSRYFWI